MAGCTYEYKGIFFTKEQLEKVTLFEKYIETSKKYFDKVQGGYKYTFLADPEQAMFEAAMQINTVAPETTKRIFGAEIYAIAKEMFPNVKTGDKFERVVPRDILKAKSKPVDYKSRILRYLQFNDIISSKKIGGEYFIKKTGKYDDLNLYKPEETERRNLDKIQLFNEKMGYDAIRLERKGNGFIIKVNPQLDLVLKSKSQNILNEDFDQDLVDYLVDRLYPSDNPVTTDILYNAVEMARDIDRPDLVNIGKFVYEFLNKNQGLKIQVEKNFNNVEILSGYPESKNETFGFYHPQSNTIYFNLDKLGKSSVESNVETIMEEFLHAISIQPFYKADKDVTNSEREYVVRIGQLFKYYKSKSNQIDDYRFTNIGEFIVGLTMDPEFQEHILDIQKSTAEPGLLQRIINWFFRAVSDLLGIKYDSVSANEALIQPTLDLLRGYLTSVDRVSNNNYLKEKGRNYDLVFPAIGNRRNNPKDRKIAESLEVFIKNIDQIRRTGLSNKLNEQQKIALEGVRRDLNSITDKDIEKMAIFSEFVNDLNSIIRVNLNQIKQVEEDESVSPEQRLANLHTIMSTTKAFDLSIDTISKVKRYVDDVDTGLSKTIDSILSNRATIGAIYKDVILPIVLDKYDNIFEYSVLDGNKLLDKELDFKKEKLAKAEAKNDKGLINVLTKEINVIIEKKRKLLPTRQRIEDLLTGKGKDSNFTSMYLEAWALSEDPTVSGLVDYIKRQFGKTAVSLQASSNEFQKEHDLFQKGTGLTSNNPEKLHEDLIETVKQIKSFDGEKFEYKEKLALKNEYNKDYIKDAQEFIYRLNAVQERLRYPRDQAHKEELLGKLREIRKAQREWEKNYMERPYTNFYYKVFEILHEDLGGFTAAEALHDIDDKLYQTEKAIRTTTDENTLDDLYLQKDDILRERKRLYSIFEKSEGTKERIIADQLKKYKEESRKLADYKLTAKGLAKFNRDFEKLNDKLKSGQITEKEYKRWLDENTVQESFKDIFWVEYNNVLNELSKVMEEMGVQKDKNIAEIYAEIRNIGNVYRNTDGLIEGEEVKKEEAATIKALQEKAIKLKDQAETIIGLTKPEKKRYYELLHISQDPYISDSEWAKYSAEYAELANKKKNISKDLMTRYKKAITDLAKLTESIPTPNYSEEYDRQLDLYAASFEINEIPNRFHDDEHVYSKIGNSWFDDKGIELTNPEYTYRKSKAEMSFTASEWFKNNHIKVDKWESDGQGGGEYIEVDQPIYIWMKMEPKDKNYIDTDPKPGFKYRERIVKSEFINRNYKASIDGYNQPRLTGAKDDRYINKEYLKMSTSNDVADKAKVRYLNFLTRKHLEGQRYLPESQRIGYFLPSVRKDWIESLQAGDYNAKSVYEKIGELGRRFKEGVKVNEQDKDTIFGHVSSDYDVLPVKMTGDIELKDQSRDATQAIMLFFANNMDYKNLSESLPFINAVRDIVSDPENNPLISDSSGNIVKRTIRGKLFGVKKSGSNRARLIDEVYRTYYLGEKRKNEAAAKAIDSSLGFAAKMMLGLNITSLISNYTNAEVQKVLLTGAEGIGTAKEYAKAHQMYSTLIPDLIKDSAKIGNKSYHGQLVDYFGGINNDTEFARDLKYTHLRNTTSAFMMPTSLAETEISNTVFITVALNFKVRRDKEFISMYDAFEIDPGGNLRPKAGITIDEETYSKFRRKLTSAMRKVNGNYNSLDSTLAEKYTAGRMVFFMNKFYVPFFANRWGGTRYDFETEKITSGYYRVFLNRFWADLKNFNYNMVSNWSSMTPEQRSAYKRVGVEIMVSAVCMALIAALGGDEPEDLKTNGKFINNMIYQLNIIRSQNESFIPFPTLGLNEMINRVKNPFPLMTKITNAGKLLQDGFYTMVYPLGLSDENDVFYTKKSGFHNKGDLKVVADLDRLFGIFYRFKNLNNPEVAIKNFEAAQRIK